MNQPPAYKLTRVPAPVSDGLREAFIRHADMAMVHAGRAIGDLVTAGEAFEILAADPTIELTQEERRVGDLIRQVNANLAAAADEFDAVFRTYGEIYAESLSSPERRLGDALRTAYMRVKDNREDQ